MQFCICTWDLQLPCHVRSCFLLTHHIWLSEKRRKTDGRFFRDYQTLWWRAFGLMTWENFLLKKMGKIDDLGKVEQPPITDLSQVIRTKYSWSIAWEFHKTSKNSTHLPDDQGDKSRTPWCHGNYMENLPIGSMYAIYGNIYHQYTPNVSIYTIHGSYGLGNVETLHPSKRAGMTSYVFHTNVHFLPL